MTKVTAQQVAEHAGVSRAAVSRTFSNRGYISAETREKVLRSARILDYRVNILARSLNRQRTDIVGVVVTSLDNPFLARQVEAISLSLLTHELKPMLLPSANHSISQLIDMVLQYNLSGIIVVSDTPPAAIYQTCIEHRIPVVLINKADHLPNVDRVVCDNSAGIKLLAQRFEQANCRNLLVISSQRESYSLRQREQLMVDQAKQLGMTVTVKRADEHSYHGGCQLGIELLASAQSYDGIFCGNDYMALGVIDTLKKLDHQQRFAAVKLAGFDNLPQAAWLSYDLTTIEQPTHAMAEAAIDLLIRRMATPEAEGASVIVGVSLIERGSL